MRQPFIADGHMIPVPESRRVSTDVICTIIGALYALTLFILACIWYSGSALDSTYFNFDSSNGGGSSSDYYGYQTAFWATVVTAFGLGLIWLAIVHLATRIAPHIAHVLAIVVLITLGVLTLIVPSGFFSNNSGWKLAVAIFCFILAIIIFCMWCFYSNELRLQGIFLDYAKRFLHDATGTFAYILLFLIFMAGLIALIVFQHLAFTSRTHKNNNYWDFSNPGLLGILNIIEFIWGFQFLRDAFNFCVSGRATDWYWNNHEAKWHTPIVRLLTRHWGSVVGGSFVNGFFEIPTLIVELFTCHAHTCCHKIGQTCDNKGFLDVCFGLVRTDAYSYITLSSLPFCNSARECHRINLNSSSFVGSYNPMKHYRFVACVFLTALGYLLGHIYVNRRLSSFTWWHNVILVLIVYAVICWFVKIDADAAEGISTSFFAEHYLAKDYEHMAQAQHPFRQEIAERSHRDTKTHDGHLC